MFDEKSRYVKEIPYEITDRRGRRVLVVTVPPPPFQSLAGYHVWMQGQRPDHLAAKYSNNSAGFWRIAEINDAMLPEVLSEKPEIAIPL